MTNRFYYCSDLHIEFASPKAPLLEGENIILAGDISVLRCLNPVMNDAGNRKCRDRTLKFFEIIQENFKNVYYLTGNHESYNFNIDLESEYISKYLPGVIHLNDSEVQIDEKTVLLGGSLWTDFNNENPLTMEVVRRGMNDFKLIYTGENDSFKPEHALEKHRKTMIFLKDAVERNKNKKIVIATHHAPSFKGINRSHGGNNLDYGYATDLSEFILDNPQIKAWVFGHTHIQTWFNVGDTVCYSNARGYEGYEKSADYFSFDKWFEV